MRMTIMETKGFCLVYIDGDELVYKATVPKTFYKKELTWYESKKCCVEQEGSMDGVKRVIINPQPITIQEQLDNMIKKIIYQCSDDDFILSDIKTILVFSGATNFRKTRYPDYKANRTQPKPVMYGFGLSYLTNKYEYITAVDEEADDRMVIESRKTGGILASSDKDFLTVPGKFYNIMKGTLTEISKEEAVYNFYTQMLVGDRADNIQGCTGIGPVKAKKLLDPGGCDRDWYIITWHAYQKSGHTIDDFEKAGFLLHLRKYEGEMFTFSTKVFGVSNE